MKILRATPLTSPDFAPFGDVVEAAAAKTRKLINEGHTTRFHDLANVRSQDGNSKVSVNIFRSEAHQLPVTIRQMERHPKSSQLFMPLGRHPYLVVVAPAGNFDRDKMRAFIAHPDQGVNYHPGTWHHYSLALEDHSDFFVVDYPDIPDNCDIADLAQPVQVTR